MPSAPSAASINAARRLVQLVRHPCDERSVSIAGSPHGVFFGYALGVREPLGAAMVRRDAIIHGLASVLDVAESGAATCDPDGLEVTVDMTGPVEEPAEKVAELRSRLAEAEARVAAAESRLHELVTHGLNALPGMYPLWCVGVTGLGEKTAVIVRHASGTWANVSGRPTDFRSALHDALRAVGREPPVE